MKNKFVLILILITSTLSAGEYDGEYISDGCSYSKDSIKSEIPIYNVTITDIGTGYWPKRFEIVDHETGDYGNAQFEYVENGIILFGKNTLIGSFTKIENNNYVYRKYTDEGWIKIYFKKL